MNTNEVANLSAETDGLIYDTRSQYTNSLSGYRFLEHPEYFRSYRAFLRSDFQNAGRILEKLVEEFQDRGQYLNDLGICYYLQGKGDLCRGALEKSVKILGKHSAPYINLRYIFNYDRFPGSLKKMLEPYRQVPENQADFTDCLVSIIILEYNNPELTLACLRSIKSSVVTIPYEIILIDNSSSDSGVDYVQTAGMDNIVYKKNEMNAGFAAGSNQGAALARGRFLYFVNNDTLFQEDCVEELARVLLSDGAVGIVGSKLLYQDNTIQHAGVVFDSFTQKPIHRCHLSLSEDSSANVAIELQAVTAASLMMKRELFFELGGFPEEYLNGYEDIELCLKARKAGYKIIYNPRSVLYHFESKSEGRFDHEEENRQRFREKWKESVQADEMKYLAPKDIVILCYTENPKKRKRQRQLYALFNFLDRKHPEIIDLIPLFYFEKAKHYRIQKCCNEIFYEFLRRGNWKEAKIIYNFFLKRHWFRYKHIKQMRSALPPRPVLPSRPLK